MNETAEPEVAPPAEPGSELDAGGPDGVTRSTRAASWAAFRAMLLRDFTVLDKQLAQFVSATVMQPLMLVFVLTYVFPKIGQAIGGAGGSARFSSLLMAGLVAQAIIFFGIFNVGMDLVREFNVTGELEDRVLAPTPVSIVAVEKIVAGGLVGLFTGMVVFPVAAFVPATPVYLDVNLALLATIAPLTCLMAAAIGLTLGSFFNPRTASYLFGVVALPLSFLGAIFYSWSSLDPIPWLKYALLANPLVYASEGLRAALVAGEPHLSLVAVYAALIAFTVLFTAVGIRIFKRRVLT
ncbi:ABC transporter permease [soil metagenome]